MTASWPGTSLIGRRIVVRFRTGDTAPSGRPQLTDVIGHLRSIGPDHLRLERRDGTEVTIQRADVATWKQVPDAPARVQRA